MFAFALFLAFSPGGTNITATGPPTTTTTTTGIHAVALLDSTVKVFHDDSLKFFLSLYGHKLPVMSMDISDDGALLATGSADKTLKIWGLDFGDCHRSLLAHDDSIMVIYTGWIHALFSLRSCVRPFSLSLCGSPR